MRMFPNVSVCPLEEYQQRRHTYCYTTTMDEIKVSANDAQILMLKNELSYETPVRSGLVSSRQHVSQPFDKTSYQAGEQPRIIVNNSTYINGPGSFLSFKVEIEGKDANFGTGSCLNLFSEIRINSRSGQPLVHMQRADITNYIRDKYNSSVNYRATFGKVMGYGGGKITFGAANAQSFIVPMASLTGLFGQKELIPASLLAGATIELTLNNFNTVLVEDVALSPPTGYKVRDLRLVLDSHLLRDSALRQLQQQQASVDGGLQFSYSSYFTVEDKGSSVSIDVSRASAMPIRVFAIARDTVKMVSVADDSYLNAVTAGLVTNWQYRAGSSFLPQAPVTSSAESFMYSTLTWRKTRDDDAERASQDTYPVAYDKFLANQWVLSQSLDRSAHIPLSSNPTNNSRIVNLAADINFGGNATWTVVMEHLLVAKTFADSVVVAQ